MCAIDYSYQFNVQLTLPINQLNYVKLKILTSMRECDYRTWNIFENGIISQIFVSEFSGLLFNFLNFLEVEYYY